MYTAVQDNLSPNLTEIKRSLSIFDDKVVTLESNLSDNRVGLSDVSFLNLGDYVSIQNKDYLIEDIDYSLNTITLQSELPLNPFLVGSPVTWHHQNQRFIDLFRAATETADKYLGNPFYAKNESGEIVRAVPLAVKEWCIKYVSSSYNVNELSVFKIKVDKVGETQYSTDIFNSIQHWKFHHLNESSETLLDNMTFANELRYGYVANVRSLVYFGRYM